MVFFNDPVLQDDHAARAVRWRVDIRERFKDLAAEWRRRGHVLEVGIGIATGYATMGRIGFEGRYDYGGVGNAIILASRLSGEAVAGQILLAAADVRRRSTRRSPSRSASASSRASAGRCRSTSAASAVADGGRAPRRARRDRPDARDPIDAAAFADLVEMTGGELDFVDELVDTYLEDGGRQLERSRRRSSGRPGGRRPRGALAEVRAASTSGALGPRRALPDARGGGPRRLRSPDAAERVAAIAAGFDAVVGALSDARATRPACRNAPA